MKLQEIQKNAIEKNLEIKKVKDKILQRQAQIERLEKKKYKLQKNSWWGDLLIRPIMELVKQEFPQLTWDLERLVPMGMCNRVLVFGKCDGLTVAMIGFTPMDIENGILNYDVSERKGDYMSDPNGFSIKSEPLTNIKDLFNHIEKQLIKNLEIK
jgi:hypothetical protein